MIIKTIAKETYKCQQKAYIDKSMRSELNNMSQELLLCLYSALSQGQDQGLCPPNNLGHFAQDSSIL